MEWREMSAVIAIALAVLYTTAVAASGYFTSLLVLAGVPVVWLVIGLFFAGTGVKLAELAVEKAAWTVSSIGLILLVLGIGLGGLGILFSIFAAWVPVLSGFIVPVFLTVPMAILGAIGKASEWAGL